MQDQVIGGINKAIKEHARASADWKHQSKADKAYALFEVINEQLFSSDLPEVVIGFADRLKKSGEYYFEGDNISINRHFDIRTDLSGLELFIAVLHNAVHVQQDVYKPKGQWYHGKPFTDAMAQYGIEVNDLGNTTGLDPDVLDPVLGRLGLTHLQADLLDFDATEAEVSTSPDTGEVLTKAKIESGNLFFSKPKGKSKMKKWSCGCTNVRVATNLTAYCTTCDADFEEQM